MGKTHRKEKEFKQKGRPPLNKNRGQDWYNESFLPEIYDDGEELETEIEWEEYKNGKIHPEEEPDKQGRSK